MWLAHHFPGLGLTPEGLGKLTPEETKVLTEQGRSIVKAKGEEWIAHTKIIARAAGGR